MKDSPIHHNPNPLDPHCSHDPVFRHQNEAAGGTGCPLCYRQAKQKDLLAAELFRPTEIPDPKLTPPTGSQAQAIWDSLADRERGAKHHDQK